MLENEIRLGLVEISRKLQALADWLSSALNEYEEEKSLQLNRD